MYKHTQYKGKTCVMLEVYVTSWISLSTAATQPPLPQPTTLKRPIYDDIYFAKVQRNWLRSITPSYTDIKFSVEQMPLLTLIYVNIEESNFIDFRWKILIYVHSCFKMHRFCFIFHFAELRSATVGHPD